MRFGILFSVFLACFGGALSAQSLVPDRRLALIRDMDIPGGDIRTIFDTTLNACEQACLSNPACVAFTYNTKSNACFPKSGLGEMVPYDGAFSGRVINARGGAVDLGERRAADLDFLNRTDLERARDVAKDLTNKHVPNRFTAADFLQSASEARANGNIVQAYRFTGAATVLSDAPDHWVEYARLAMAIETDNSSEKSDYRRRALAAAINGYLRADTAAVQHSALVVMAEALELAKRGRDMIPALRLAQSIQPRTDTEDMLADAVSKYGFRIVEHTVDNNSARPRICAEFSGDLVRAGVDYTPYVQVPSAELTVEPDQRRLCLEGVVHGERYRVTFREGLPAASGEALIRNVTLNLYVRDRSPAVRFPGRAYILPATGGEINIPVETVNTTELDLKLRRVSDRSILQAIQEGFFGRPLSPWEERNFGDTMAETVWTGSGEVFSDLNKDVVTRLPLEEVIDAMDPGIYALQASIPDSDPYDTPAATQWFVVSDLGIATMNGADGLHIFARGLGDAEPLAGAEVTLLSRSNAILGERVTDEMGYARFEPGLMNGTGGARPAMVLATVGNDLTFLSLTDPEFDLSDRGVEGRAPAGPIDTFLTTDRGAYRAGETINATVLTRDAESNAIEGLPIVAILTRPDGVEYSRQLSENPRAGGHVFNFRTSGEVPRGSWRLDIHADPDAPSIASTKVLVEDFLPERIDFAMSLPDGMIEADAQPLLTIQADYLFGAPAGDLPVEGHIVLRSTSSLADYPGYTFGRYDDRRKSEVWFLPQIRTDADGRAVIGLELPQLQPDFRPQEVEAIVSVSEGSGRPVERTLTKAIAPASDVIGIKPGFDDTLAENTEASFSLIALDTTQTPTEMEVRWTVNRVETRYQWYSYDGRWDWEPITTRTKVADGSVTLGATPVTVSAPVEWGRYEIKVERTGGTYVAASTDFYAGWYGGADASATPDLLELSLNAESYRPGDTATVRVVPRDPGKGLITVVSNRLIDMRAVDLVAGENVFDLPVTDAWGAGAYVAVTAIRPMDAAAGRNPTRALGLTHAGVDPGPHELKVRIESPPEVDPRGPMPVAVRVDGLQPGETGWVTLAAVDVGILNLTRFESPDPNGHYFGQRKLGMGLRDVYGRLIDGMSGSVGNIRSGGDFVADAGLDAPPPTEELVAYFSGPLEVGEDGYARATFDMPSFNGTVRLMAVAWSRTGVGSADGDVLVRDPVVVTASVPRFMTPGDSSRLLLEIVHTSGPTGRMGLDVSTEGLRIGRRVPSGFDLAENAKQVFGLPITAEQVGIGKITVNITTPAGKLLTKELMLPVQINDPAIARASRFDLAAGDTFTFDSDVFTGYRAGSGSATLAAGPVARLDAPGLLQALDRYPYGCTEQTTSRAMPLLYLDEVARAMGLAERDQLSLRIEQAIERVLTRQAPNGAFGLWRASSGDFWLDAYVTDFLSRARAQGFDVPPIAFRNALDNLRNRVNYAADFDEGGEDIAYALYVLAREGAAAIGDLRYFADVKGSDFGSPLAAAQIGAALAAYGDPTRADRMFAIAARMIQGLNAGERHVWRADYGTRFRDRAAVLTLAAEAGSNAVDYDALLDSIAPVEPVRHLSTQEKVWSLLAAHALLDSDAFGDLTMNGAALDGPLVKVVEDDTAFAPIQVENVGDSPATITLTTFGVPVVPEPAGGNGYAISRRYFDMDGTPVELDTIVQGTRLVAVVTVQPFSASAGRLIIDDPLPAGFEIDNPNLMRGGDVRELDWLDLTSNTRNAEFRQDRFIAAVDWRSKDAFRLGYIVRAVSPGEFHHPAASVEDMYRPEFRANSDAGRVTIVE